MQFSEFFRSHVQYIHTRMNKFIKYLFGTLQDSSRQHTGAVFTELFRQRETNRFFYFHHSSNVFFVFGTSVKTALLSCLPSNLRWHRRHIRQCQHVMSSGGYTVLNNPFFCIKIIFRGCSEKNKTARSCARENTPHSFFVQYSVQYNQIGLPTGSRWSMETSCVRCTKNQSAACEFGDMCDAPPHVTQHIRRHCCCC